ncbi:MAG TPA: hypothetical protein VG248_18220 [Caulobacteraceae bacterium]|nr:hypothetical protein [Caulobacteraceae bacterium]
MRPDNRTLGFVARCVIVIVFFEAVLMEGLASRVPFHGGYPFRLGDVILWLSWPQQLLLIVTCGLLCAFTAVAVAVNWPSRTRGRGRGDRPPAAGPVEPPSGPWG